MKSDNNCVINVVSFAQIALYKAYFSVRMRSPERASQSAVSIATRTSNDSCSDTQTLPISNWLFHSEGGASCDWAAILSVAFLPIQNYTSDTSWVFYSLCYIT